MSESRQKDNISDISEGKKSRANKAKERAKKEARKVDIAEVIALLSLSVDPFINDAGAPCVTVDIPGRRVESMPVGSRRFAGVIRMAGEQTGELLRTGQVNEIRDHYEARAIMSDKTVETPPRYGFDGVSVWIDRGTGYTQIAPDGVHCDVELPRDSIRFRQSATALPMDPPADEAATVEEFADVFGVTRESAITLMAWCMGACLPHIPCPILTFNAEAGTAKTTKSEMLRELIDPNSIAHVSLQPDLRSMAISIYDTRLWCADNVSDLSLGMSDLLCRASTGGVYSVRALRTDNELAVMTLRRAILLNGLKADGAQGDLKSRLLTVELPRITAYRPLTSVWSDFRAALPRLRRLIYNGVQACVAAIASGTLPACDPGLRMSDFNSCAQAAESAWALEPGTVSSILATQYSDAVAELNEASTLARCLVYLLSTSGGKWSGRPVELLSRLSKYADPKSLPRGVVELGEAMRREATAIRESGIAFSKSRSKRGYHYDLSTTPIFVAEYPVHTADADFGNDFA